MSFQKLCPCYTYNYQSYSAFGHQQLDSPPLNWVEAAVSEMDI